MQITTQEIKYAYSFFFVNVYMQHFAMIPGAAAKPALFSLIYLNLFHSS